MLGGAAFMSTMTITDFCGQMRGYAVARRRRNRMIISISAVVLAVTFIIAFSYPKFFLIPVGGLALIAICVTATSSGWHRRHGVFCQHCGHSLVSLRKKMQEVDAEVFAGAPIPDSLSCPHCREIVVTIVVRPDA
jgi:hypothetical protein